MDGQRLLFSISKALLLLTCIFILILPVGATAEIWTVLAVDVKGDGRAPSLADAAQLSYRYDKQQDLLWFRVTVYGKPNEEAFGVNLAIDTGAGDDAKMNWWGTNKDFRFDKLITAWVTRRNGVYQGTVGVADAAGARAKNFNNLLQNNLQIRVEGDSVLIGIKRTDLTDKTKMNLIAAVGSKEEWYDDTPNTRSATLDLSAPRPVRGLREIDVNRNNFRFPTDYKLLADDRSPLIIKKGRGRDTLILIPGVYSGKEVFDGFMARNQSRYRFYVVTPPGLNGTPPRPLPPETTSYGELTWTRRLKRDILDLVSREKLNRPTIVAHGFPGSLVAEELAFQHPEAVGGVIDVAAMPPQFSPSPRDPSRRTPATPEERVETVDEAWAAKWFRFVTPETWESNNYPADMFANDLNRAEQARLQVEGAPLPVKIRYLAEFMASDHTHELANITVPLLALRPGFNEKLLADPAHSWYKGSFQDSWDAFSKNLRIRLTTIPDARALILDDQPRLADDTIAAFIEHVKQTVQASETQDIDAKQVIAVERAALDRWGKGDPQGFLQTYGPEVTYFDPFQERRVDGLDEMKDLLAPIAGKVKVDRFEMLHPKVQRYGEVAVLTYNLVNYMRQADGSEKPTGRWNATTVFRRIDGKWRTIHSHWSLVKPQVSETRPAAALPPIASSRRGAVMFLGLRTLIYHAPDLAKAKAWYADAFGVAPYFDESFYVGFEIGGFELGLDPDVGGVTVGNNAVAYWRVADIDEAYQRLRDRGAEPRQFVKDVGGDIRVATLADPFGNVIGLIQDPHFKVKE